MIFADIKDRLTLNRDTLLFSQTVLAVLLVLRFCIIFFNLLQITMFPIKRPYNVPLVGRKRQVTEVSSEVRQEVDVTADAGAFIEHCMIETREILERRTNEFLIGRADQVTRLKDELEDVKSRLNETESKLVMAQDLLNKQSDIQRIIVEKLFRTRGFTEMMREVNAVSHDWIRSTTLEDIHEAYGVPTRQAVWGWNPGAWDKARKDYATLVLGSLPEFPLLQHLSERGQPLTLEEAQELDFDFDHRLTADLELEILSSFENLDIEMESVNDEN